MKVKTIQPHPYGGVHRIPGEEYEMEDRFYFAMARMGHVVRIDDTPGVIRTRDLEAEPPKKYRRRDLQSK